MFKIENIVSEYLKYTTNNLYQFFKILLGSNYSYSQVKPFVNRYIEVRYDNDTLFKREKDFVTRMSKELNIIAKEFIKDNPGSEEQIKNICALFSYILYFDDCIPYKSLDILIEALFNDCLITLKYNDSQKKEFTDFIKQVQEKKSNFFKLFENQEFVLVYNRLKTRVYDVTIEQNCTISRLYSDYAINKAFNSGIVLEDKTYLLVVMLSSIILKETINLTFNRNYIVEVPLSLLSKTKKLNRFLKALDNDILKSKISLKFKYQDYKDNKKVIDNIINLGYSVCVVIDNSFDNDFDNLVLFSYVLVYNYSDYYDIIIDSKDTLKTCVITL